MAEHVTQQIETKEGGSMNKVVEEPGFESGPWNIDEVIARVAKPVFTVATIHAEYRANTLGGAMKLWRDSGDQSEVVGVHRLG